MAKLQRWRRRGPAGEGASPDAVESDEVEVHGADTGEEAPEPTAVIDPLTAPDDGADDSTVARPFRDWPALHLLQAAHPKQGVLTAVAVFVVAVLAGRPARETGIILATVLTGQAILGWHNDLVDRRRDRAHRAAGKPVADGRLAPSTVWFAVILAALLLLPLSITTGITAGMIYLGSVAVGMLGNVLFRTTVLSWWSWAVSYGMLPAYVSYGGWGGQAVGEPPETAITVLAALAGVGVHFFRAALGLVADHEDRWRYLPLKLGLKLGATRLLMLASTYLVVVLVAMAIVASQVGLSR